MTLREEFESWFLSVWPERPADLYLYEGQYANERIEDMCCAWVAAAGVVIEKCAVYCETECPSNDGISCAESLRGLTE